MNAPALLAARRDDGAWETVSSTSRVGFTFVLDAAAGELFRIRTRLEP